MPMLALVLGIVSFAGFCLGLLPCVGWLNWVTIPFAMVSVVISIVAMAQAKSSGQPVGLAIGGLVLSVVAVCLGFVRLLLGGGVV